jgi:rRNA maturation endonuclease Nob1
MAREYTLLCRQCRNVFKLPGTLFNSDTHCPECTSQDIMEAPVWAPLGSGRNIFDSTEWEYECLKCQNKFKMPIPLSPAEEKARRCPSCSSEQINRLNAAGGEPLYCS